MLEFTIILTFLGSAGIIAFVGSKIEDRDNFAFFALKLFLLIMSLSLLMGLGWLGYDFTQNPTQMLVETYDNTGTYLGFTNTTYNIPASGATIITELASTLMWIFYVALLFYIIYIIYMAVVKHMQDLFKKKGLL